MSVGAGSIKRVAKTETKTETKAVVVAKPAEETVKAVKTPVKKAPAKKAPAKKTAAKPVAKKEPAKKPEAKSVAPKATYAIGEELPIWLR